MPPDRLRRVTWRVRFFGRLLSLIPMSQRWVTQSGDTRENQMKPRTFAITMSLAATLCVTNAVATVIAIGPGAFPGTALLTTFTGLADGTEVNGLSVGGLGFSYSLGK